MRRPRRSGEEPKALSYQDDPSLGLSTARRSAGMKTWVPERTRFFNLARSIDSREWMGGLARGHESIEVTEIVRPRMASRYSWPLAVRQAWTLR